MGTKLRTIQEIIEQLKATPNDPKALSSAQEWLTKKKKSTKSTQQILQCILASRHDRQTLAWVEQWLQGKDWDVVFWAVFNTRNIEIHDWIIEFARNNPENHQTGRLWSLLLTNYQYQSAVSGASSWLVEHAGDVNAIWIAKQVLALSEDEAQKYTARKILLQFLDDPFVVSTLIEYTSDKSASEAGTRLVQSADPITGALIASALLKDSSDENWTTVEQWLRKHWNHKSAQCLFEHVVDSAALKMAPIALEWLDDHPRARKPSQMFTSAFALSLTQELIDTIWEWLKTRLSKRYAPEMFALLFDHFGDFSTPPDAIDFADQWLVKNIKHAQFCKILLGVMRIQNTNHRIGLARQWLQNQKDGEVGNMMMNLRRRAPDSFTQEALGWAARNPGKLESSIIKHEHLRDKKKPTASDIEEMKKSLHQSPIREGLLCALVRAGDKDSIGQAKSSLNIRLIERRYSHSIRCSQVPLLLALLDSAPSDQEVIAFAENWLASNSDVCEQHFYRVREAYSNAVGMRMEE